MGFRLSQVIGNIRFLNPLLKTIRLKAGALDPCCSVKLNQEIFRPKVNSPSGKLTTN